MDPTTLPATFPADQLPPLDTIQLTTTAGVIGLTIFVVGVLKKIFGEMAFFKRVPIFVYVAIVALVVTFVANQWTQTLPGDLKTVLWESLKAALAASGFYTWMTGSGMKSLGDVASSNKSDGSSIYGKLPIVALCLILPVGVAGCQSLLGPAAPISADADPFVVNAERSLSIAWADISAFLTFDDQNRELLKAKAPQLHNVAEILRTEGIPHFEAAVQAVRLYKHTRLPGDKPDAESKLELARELAKRARIALTAAQGVTTQ